jgi:hypothetical protein
VDEKGFTAPEARAIEDIGPHGHEGFRHGSSLDEAQPAGQWHGIRFSHDAIFRIAAARHERHDFIADLEALRQFAPGCNGAGDLEPGGRRRSGRRRIAAFALKHVGTVHARSLHLDEKLALRRLRHRQGDKL